MEPCRSALTPAMPTTISHLALVVRDPARTAAMFEALFGVTAIHSPQQRRGPPETFVAVGGIWLVLVQGEPAAARTDDHIAFTVSDVELPVLAERLAALGIDSQMSRAGTAAQSLYFVDYDNHLFELHTGHLERELAQQTASTRDAQHHV